MPEPLKKYENLIEMAFRFIEQLEGGDPELTSEACHNLRAAVEALKEFRAACEPIFVLRGQDRLAPKAIESWSCFVSSYSARFASSAHARCEHDRMLEWQEAHPDLVKMPD
jgi:hypothetical protein